MTSSTYNCPKCPNFCDKPFEAFKSHWRRHHRGESRPDSVGRGFRSDLLSNSWTPILNSWSKIPLEHPFASQGLQILEHFKSNSFEAPLGTNIFSIFDFSPKFDHVFRDIEVAHFSNGATPGALVLSETGEPAEHLNLSHLQASFLACNSDNFHHFKTDNLCAAIGFDAHDLEGLEQCRPHMPSEAKHLGIPSSDDGPRLELAYTPRGHITRVHQDGFLHGSIVTTLFGRKLLITWAPTPYNLKLYFKYWPHKWNLPLDVISDLKSPKFTIIDHGHFTFIPQGHLHMVMAIDSSAMVAFGIKHPGMIKDGLLLSDSVFKHLSTLDCNGTDVKDIIGLLRDGVETHCNVDDELYADARDAANDALLWVEDQIASLP
ncbi:hypothetical protein OC845_006856 [Tilletia horrida]|nr:hypothetical protein OC845_006856 [Tilletia horrida]